MSLCAALLYRSIILFQKCFPRNSSTYQLILFKFNFNFHSLLFFAAKCTKGCVHGQCDKPNQCMWVLNKYQNTFSDYLEDIDNHLCQLVFEIISDWQIQCCQINDLTKYQDHPLIKPSFRVGWAFFGLFAARFIVVAVAVCPRLQQLSLATPFAVLFLFLFSLFTFFFLRCYQLC